MLLVWVYHFTYILMKLLLIVFFSCVSTLTYSQVNVIIQWQADNTTAASDTIYYNTNRSLTWKDFKAPTDRNSIAGAITSSGFGYTMSMLSKGNHTSIIISVYCFFDKTRSWVKRDMKTAYALLHEQHHFDITYYNACQFVKQLKATIFTRSNYDALLEKINNEHYANLEKMQNDYDGQTKNGQLTDVQAYWNKKIDQLLASLITN